MCGRFSLIANPDELAEHFEIDFEPDLEFATAWESRFNIAPSQPVTTVYVPEDSGQRAIVNRRWGLVPSWANDPKIGNRQINARSETLAEKPAFRQALKQRRCLVAADGFYEWSGPARSKQPYHIALEGREIFGFAGLWERWRDPEGLEIESCTVITAAANSVLGELHSRMPVILEPEKYDAWLDPSRQDAAELLALLRSHRCDALRYHPVSYRVNNVAYDDSACLEPVAAQPTLF
jgi:putative SOS response-associated peptidase YedK